MSTEPVGDCSLQWTVCSLVAAPQVPGLAAQSPWNQKALDVKYPPLTSDASAGGLTGKQGCGRGCLETLGWACPNRRSLPLLPKAALGALM